MSEKFIITADNLDEFDVDFRLDYHNELSLDYGKAFLQYFGIKNFPALEKEDDTFNAQILIENWIEKGEPLEVYSEKVYDPKKDGPLSVTDQLGYDDDGPAYDEEYDGSNMPALEDDDITVL